MDIASEALTDSDSSCDWMLVNPSEIQDDAHQEEAMSIEENGTPLPPETVGQDPPVDSIGDETVTFPENFDPPPETSTKFHDLLSSPVVFSMANSVELKAEPTDEKEAGAKSVMSVCSNHNSDSSDIEHIDDEFKGGADDLVVNDNISVISGCSGYFAGCSPVRYFGYDQYGAERGHESSDDDEATLTQRGRANSLPESDANLAAEIIQTDDLSIIADLGPNDLDVEPQRIYTHTPNGTVNKALNLLLLLSLTAVISLGIGHLIGLNDQPMADVVQPGRLDALANAVIYKDNQMSSDADEPDDYWRKRFESLLAENRGLKKRVQLLDKKAKQVTFDLEATTAKHQQLLNDFNAGPKLENVASLLQELNEKANEQAELLRLREDMERQLMGVLLDENKDLKSELSSLRSELASVESERKEQIEALSRQSERSSHEEMGTLREKINDMQHENEDLWRVIAKLRYAGPIVADAADTGAHQPGAHQPRAADFEMKIERIALGPSPPPVPYANELPNVADELDEEVEDDFPSLDLSWLTSKIPKYKRGVSGMIRGVSNYLQTKAPGHLSRVKQAVVDQYENYRNSPAIDNLVELGHNLSADALNRSRETLAILQASMKEKWAKLNSTEFLRELSNNTSETAFNLAVLLNNTVANVEDAAHKVWKENGGKKVEKVLSKFSKQVTDVAEKFEERWFQLWKEWQEDSQKNTPIPRKEPQMGHHLNPGEEYVVNGDGYVTLKDGKKLVRMSARSNIKIIPAKETRALEDDAVVEDEIEELEEPGEISDEEIAYHHSQKNKENKYKRSRSGDGHRKRRAMHDDLHERRVEMLRKHHSNWHIQEDEYKKEGKHSGHAKQRVEKEQQSHDEERGQSSADDVDEERGQEEDDDEEEDEGESKETKKRKSGKGRRFWRNDDLPVCNSSNPDWVFERAKVREGKRNAVSLSDWVFERARDRKEMRDERKRADWVFDRAAARKSADLIEYPLNPKLEESEECFTSKCRREKKKLDRKEKRRLRKEKRRNKRGWAAAVADGIWEYSDFK